MSKFGGFLARKASTADHTGADFTASPAQSANNPLELDEELFSALGAQLGSENETLRNLLVDANSKIAELDTIKAAVGKLSDPVSKALRAFESEKSEKISLQTILNNTRTAYGKLRNEMADFEKRATNAESECHQLRQELATMQNVLRGLEVTKAEIAIDVAARRAQIADLEGRLAQETGECKALREENHRFNDRLVAADKRIVALESDLNSARQRLLVSEDEKRALQASFDKTVAEAARLSRKLAETEASLTTAQGRLRHVEANVTELATERARLTSALDEANERYEHELNSQRMRTEALTARAEASDRLLVEARQHLLARAEEMRDFDRRLSESALSRDTLDSRVAELETDRIQRESEIKELDQAKTTLLERTGALTRAYNAKDAALTRAEDNIKSLNERIAALEGEIVASKQTAEQRIEELNAALRREKMERSVVEGALETGRKDFARLMRETMALQRERSSRDDDKPFAANAA